MYVSVMKFKDGMMDKTKKVPGFELIAQRAKKLDMKYP